MSVALQNSVFLALAQALDRLPTVADLLRAMNRDAGLSDGSRYL